MYGKNKEENKEDWNEKEVSGTFTDSNTLFGGMSGEKSGPGDADRCADRNTNGNTGTNGNHDTNGNYDSNTNQYSGTNSDKYANAGTYSDSGTYGDEYTGAYATDRGSVCNGDAGRTK